MVTTIYNPSESSTIDVLWNILSSQTETVKKALAVRLRDSLSKSEKTLCTGNLKEAMAYVETLSVKGEISVPDDENGIEALINEKFVK
ncbi:MAG: hypothetical protein IKT83_04080 [Bacteroidaceae bacterium]|nr:hypothetical protein [Bacteroidaceae bacterium]